MPRFRLLEVVIILVVLLAGASAIASGSEAFPAAPGVGAAGQGRVSSNPGSIIDQGRAGLKDAGVQPQNVRLVSQLGGETQVAAVRGNYAYVGIGSRLTILSVSSPNNPVIVGQSVPLADVVNGIALAGSRAYIADGSGGLRIFDISNPGSPIEIGAYDPSDSNDALAVAIAGNYAYVADSSTLRILNVSDPTTVTEAGTYNSAFGDISQVAVQGNIAYVLAGAYGVSGSTNFEIIDVTNPISPTGKGNVGTVLGSYFGGMTVSGNYAYLADGNAGLRILDVSNPANPVQAGTYDTPGYARDVAVDGQYAYVADWSDILTIDVSKPATPTLASMFAPPGNPVRLTIAGQYAYAIQDGIGGLQVYGIADHIKLFMVSAYTSPPDSANDVSAAGHYAYLASLNSGLHVVDIANVNSPVETGHSQAASYASGVDAAGNYAYVADQWNGLRIFDITNPAAPVLASTFYTPNIQAQAVVVSGTYAYLADSYNGLRVIEIGNRAAPKQVGAYVTTGYAGVREIRVKGSYTYLATGSYGLQIVNVSNPAKPVLVYTDPWPGGAFDVFVYGNYAYVPDGFNGIRVLNIANPASPVELSPVTSIYPSKIFAAGQYAYAADSSHLYILDLSNPAAPVKVGAQHLPGQAGGIFAAGSVVYIADGSGGLVIARHSASESGVIAPGGGLFTTAAGDITYTIPSGCFTGSVTITHTLLFSDEVASPGPLLYAGHAFDVEGAFTASGGPALPQTPYTLTVHYTPGDLGPIDENTLALYYWNGSQWLKETTSAVTPADHRVTATPDHFSRWMLVGTAVSYPKRAFLPVIARSFTPLDLTITGLEFTQAIQNPANDVPLVAGRPTIARVYASTSRSSPLNDVYLSISATRNGLPLPGSPQIVGPWAVFPNPSRGTFGQSYNLALPAAWLSGGISLAATIDSSGTITEVNEANNTATAALTFNVMPTLKVKIVPINYTDKPTGKVFPAPTVDTISDWVLRSYPISSISTTIRAPINFTGNLASSSEWNRLLDMVTGLKSADGAPSSQDYYGLIPTTNPAGDSYDPAWGGLGWIGQRAAIGLNYSWTGASDQSVDATGQIAAHEIGHNFSLGHAPCGVAGDPYFPYPNASIGQYGFDVFRYRIWSPGAPDNTKDVMSYCSPQWFSDYNYKKLYANQMSHGLSPAVSIPVDSFLIRAAFNANDTLALQPIYGFPAVPSEAPVSSDYTLEMLNTTGDVILTQPVTVYQAEEQGFVARTISAIVRRPSQPVAKLRLLQSGRSVAERDLVNLSTQTTALAPEVAETAGTLIVRWGAPEVPALVRYTVDDGESWTTVGLDVSGGELQLDPQTLPGGQGYFEIELADSMTPTARTIPFTASK